MYIALCFDVSKKRLFKKDGYQTAIRTMSIEDCDEFVLEVRLFGGTQREVCAERRVIQQRLDVFTVLMIR